jgi:hypothetical protein
MADWTPPPPGDRREQLPDHLLAAIDIPDPNSIRWEPDEELDYDSPPPPPATPGSPLRTGARLTPREDDRDPTAAGRAWMCGRLSSEAYFAMVRRQVRAREPGRRRWWMWRRKEPRK